MSNGFFKRCATSMAALILAGVSGYAQTRAPQTKRTQIKLGNVIAQPQLARIATVKQPFSVGYTYGDRDTFKVIIERAGKITVTAEWHGDVTGLALILNGPGQTNSYARLDGATPLTINFDVTPELFARVSEWTVTISNFTGRGSASGLVKITYPAPVRKLADLTPTQRVALKLGTRGKPSCTKPGQKILADGTVEICQADGTIVQLHSSCGKTVYRPDGLVMSQQCVQVQPGNPPALPSSPPLLAWLTLYNDSLLSTLQSLFKSNPESLDNLKNLEKGKPLLEQIRLRIGLINRIAAALSEQN